MDKIGIQYRQAMHMRAVSKWFKGKELATAMGVQVALARIGSQAGSFA